jgi:hypothetical protein
MIKQSIKGYSSNTKTAEPVQTHIFKKEEGIWYIHLPEYLEQGWSKKELEMAEGAEKLLNTIANGRDRVMLRLSDAPFEGADNLELMEICDAPKGGAVYLLDTCHGKEIGSFIWICDIALFVFGDMPENIYFQSVKTQRQKKA